MGMMLAKNGAARALSLTLCPLPRAGEGNVWSRAVRDKGISMASLPGALEWE